MAYCRTQLPVSVPIQDLDGLIAELIRGIGMQVERQPDHRLPIHYGFVDLGGGRRSPNPADLVPSFIHRGASATNATQDCPQDDCNRSN